MGLSSVASRVLAISVALAVPGGYARAVPSGGHLVTPHDGSSFTSACTGHNFGGFGLGQNLGRDLSTFGYLNAANGAANCGSGTSSGVGLANSSAADGGPIGILGGSFNGAAQGAATAGVIKLQASNTTSTTNSSQRFTGAVANGGWNDNMTVTGGTGQGLMTIPIHISGTVNAQDTGTMAIFQLQPYQNGSALSSSSAPPIEAAAVAFFNALNQKANGDVIFAWDYQMSAYGELNDGPGGTPDSQTIDEFVTLVLPFTYGLAFDFGIFSSVLVGERAQGAARGTAEVQFQNTVTWTGDVSIFDWNATDGITGENTDFLLTAASGLDYTQSFDTQAPEPGSLAVALAGLAGLGWMRRRHQAAA
jgi:MYXO-CTERM domain-containing protein